MLACRAIIPHRLAVFIAGSPFDVDQAMATQYDIIAGKYPGLRLDTPSILDFTEVRVSDLSATELIRFVRQRRALVERPTTGPLSFVCSGKALFGMLRMFAMLAEVGGLWPEKSVFVTTEPARAMAWIAEKANLAPEEVHLVVEALREAPGWVIDEAALM